MERMMSKVGGAPLGRSRSAASVSAAQKRLGGAAHGVPISPDKLIVRGSHNIHSRLDGSRSGYETTHGIATWVLSDA